MIPFHPILFSLYPILFLYSVNLDKVELSQVLRPLLISFLFTLGILLFLRGLLNNKTKASLISTTILFAFFSYGHIYELILSIVGENVLENIFLPRNIIVVWSISFILLVYLLVRTKRNLSNISRALNVFSVILVLLVLFNIAKSEFSKNNQQFLSESVKREGLGNVPKEELPDVYYIILDAYAGEETLSSVYGFDNSEFLKSLSDQGFYVSKNSYSNYMMTSLSLASSLNMDYLDNLLPGIDRESIDNKPAYSLIENSFIIEEFRKSGYLFINFSSGWGPTNYIDNADINYQGVNLDEFTIVLLRTTMLGPGEFVRPLLRNRILFSFDELESTGNSDEPVFILAHFLLPHPPWLFGRDGENISGSQIALAGDTWQEKDKYIDQLIFTNTKTTKLVDLILKDRKKPIVIILQGDHGPSSVQKAGNRRYKERLGILNAYYFSDKQYSSLYESISPVNSFRIIINKYFGEDFETLPDKSFYSQIGRPYEYEEVSDYIQ